MGKREVYFGIVLMALSVIVFSLTFQFPRQTLAMSPRLFPRVISVGLFVLAGVLAWYGIRGMRQRREAEGEKTVSGRTLIRFGALIIIAFLYTRILVSAGYVLATPLFIAGVMLLFNEKRWIWISTVSIITTILLYFLFRTCFRVPLPRFIFF